MREAMVQMTAKRFMVLVQVQGKQLRIVFLGQSGEIFMKLLSLSSSSTAFWILEMVSFSTNATAISCRRPLRLESIHRKATSVKKAYGYRNLSSCKIIGYLVVIDKCHCHKLLPLSSRVCSCYVDTQSCFKNLTVKVRQINNSPKTANKVVLVV